ncbi:hypothetical protein BJX99DRAFT_256581 [Aspergillus californicus]
MGIHIEIRGVDSKKTFTPGEAVPGVVYMRLHRSTVLSDINVSLQGSIQTSIIEKGPPFILGNDSPTVVTQHIELLKSQKTLHPPTNIYLTAGGYTLAKGEYTFPFEVAFPETMRAKYEDKPSSVPMGLPPSFHVRSIDHGAEVKIEYVLKVGVRRPGRLRKRTSLQQILEFSPLHTPLHTISSPRPGYYSSNDAVSILSLEGTTLSPVLYAGGQLSLHLSLRSYLSQTELILPLRLRSLAITLQSTTAITAGTQSTSWTSSRPLYRVDGLKKLVCCFQESEALSDINDTLQNVVIPEVTPTFTTTTVQHRYSLGITAVVSVGQDPNSMPINLVLDVEIWPRVSA